MMAGAGRKSPIFDEGESMGFPKEVEYAEAVFEKNS
jgi:hypothetical protein